MLNTADTTKGKNGHSPHFSIHKIIKVKEKSAPVPAAAFSSFGQGLEAWNEVWGIVPDIKGQVFDRQAVYFLIGAYAAEGGGIRVIGHEVWGRLLVGTIGILVYSASGRSFTGFLFIKIVAADLTEQLVGGVERAASAAPFGGAAIIFFLVSLNFGRLPLLSLFMEQSENASAAFLGAFLVVGGAAVGTDDDLVGFGEFFVTVGAVDAFVFKHCNPPMVKKFFSCLS